MLTTVDFVRLKEMFATKKDLAKLRTELIEFVRTSQADLKKELREDIVTFKDQILTEIIKLRQDITVIVGYRDIIGDHAYRIEKLEAKNIPA